MHDNEDKINDNEDKINDNTKNTLPITITRTKNKQTGWSGPSPKGRRLLNFCIETQIFYLVNILSTRWSGPSPKGRRLLNFCIETQIFYLANNLSTRWSGPSRWPVWMRGTAIPCAAPVSRFG